LCRERDGRNLRKLPGTSSGEDEGWRWARKGKEGQGTGRPGIIRLPLEPEVRPKPTRRRSLVGVQVAKRKKISENTERTRVRASPRREPLVEFSAARPGAKLAELA